MPRLSSVSPQPEPLHQPRPTLLNTLGKSLLLGLFTLPLAAYGWGLHHRPTPQDQAPRQLFQGVTYERIHFTQPRPQLIHRLTLDLTAPGLKPWTTPSIAVTAPDLAPPVNRALQTAAHRHTRLETIAQKATTALETHGLQLAINANFFFPFVEQAPWHTTPAEGEPVSLVGTAIAQGLAISPIHENWPALCFLSNTSMSASTLRFRPKVPENQLTHDQLAPIATTAKQNADSAPKAAIAPNGQCPAQTYTAVAGNLLLLEEGRPGQTADENLTKPYPMVIAALDASGQQLQLILIDGKQPFYSEGITLPEAIALLQSWGIHQAVRLDGGGSTSLAVEGPSGQAQLLNAVIQAKVPGRERPVGNHLGFYALPLPAQVKPK